MVIQSYLTHPTDYIHIHLATDQFCRVVQTRWKENFINLTVRADQSLKELKWGLSKAGTTAMKEGTEEIGPDELKIEITRFEIQIEPLKTKIESQPIGATPLLRRLLFGLGRSSLGVFVLGLVVLHPQSFTVVSSIT